MAGLEMIPERRVASVGAFAKALGAPLARAAGASLALSVEQPDAPRTLMEAIVKTAAGVFEAAASSIALIDRDDRRARLPGRLGRGRARDRRRRLPPGAGIAGDRRGERARAEAVRDCRSDPRFAGQIAAGTGYVPYTMLVVPLMRRRPADRRAVRARPPRRRALRGGRHGARDAVRRAGDHGARRRARRSATQPRLGVAPLTSASRRRGRGSSCRRGR